ncbi:hypothetical protein KBC31_00600 [Candidatus Saccharibacteria bacterium]|nr:hypothetical protein [Candidatus Saccharibacteria bacterium]
MHTQIDDRVEFEPRHGLFPIMLESLNPEAGRFLRFGEEELDFIAGANIDLLTEDSLARVLLEGQVRDSLQTATDEQATGYRAGVCFGLAILRRQMSSTGVDDYSSDIVDPETLRTLQDEIGYGDNEAGFNTYPWTSSNAREPAHNVAEYAVWSRYFDNPSTLAVYGLLRHHWQHLGFMNDLDDGPIADYVTNGLADTLALFAEVEGSNFRAEETVESNFYDPELHFPFFQGPSEVDIGEPNFRLVDAYFELDPADLNSGRPIDFSARYSQSGYTVKFETNDGKATQERWWSNSIPVGAEIKVLRTFDSRLVMFDPSRNRIVQVGEKDSIKDFALEDRDVLLVNTAPNSKNPDLVSMCYPFVIDSAIAGEAEAVNIVALVRDGDWHTIGDDLEKINDANRAIVVEGTNIFAKDIAGRKKHRDSFLGRHALGLRNAAPYVTMAVLWAAAPSLKLPTQLLLEVVSGGLMWRVTKPPKLTKIPNSKTLD